MCGIFGFSKAEGSLTKKQLKILRRSISSIAEESSVRGRDSTGLAIINKDRRDVYKTLMPSDKVVHTKEWADIVNCINGDTITLIGHTRYATTGTVSKRNAHPFHYGDIIGAHNGCIYNWNKIDGHKKSMEVDSEIIFSRLDKLSYSSALKDLEGYFALSWVNKNPYDLYLARDESPTYIAYWKSAKTLFWASTEDILSYGLLEGGLNIECKSLPSYKIHKYHTKEFGSLPYLSSEDMSRKKQKRLGSRVVYSNYNAHNWCHTCGRYMRGNADTCSDCIADQNSHVSFEWGCDICLREFDLNNLTFETDSNLYWCSDCISGNFKADLHECDYCGEEFENTFMSKGSNYSICLKCHSDLNGGRHYA